MESNIRQAQRLVFESLVQATSQLQASIERDGFGKAAFPESKGKQMVRQARSLKWDAGRVARLARAVEMLESLDPHFEDR